MKKLLDCVVLALVFLLLYFVFAASVVGGEITAVKTRNGNYTLYQNGKLVGYVSQLPSGNIKVREMWGNTKKTRARASNTRRSTPKVQASQPPHMTDKEYDEMLKRWRMSRLSAFKAGGMYWWELAYPSVFHR